ncbi:hypothetical protein POM88_002593 [Heracleum sosnowskyi]|uniref:Retrotransposon gag domain-containing protein n=1 Tax=Heracleum sosnowskyi TaxID=360622 RepID=A0AAD8JH12_9APIA|nr:hypothetical protein POM88_002593 [Heracleum sosnowskyi]
METRAQTVETTLKKTEAQLLEIQNHGRKTDEDLQNLSSRMDSALQVLAALATKVETLTHKISVDHDGEGSKKGYEDVRIGALHLQGKAKSWYIAYKISHKKTGWPQFCGDVLSRFKMDEFESVIGELTKLQQTKSIEEFQIRFEELLPLVRSSPKSPFK